MQDESGNQDGTDDQLYYYATQGRQPSSLDIHMTGLVRGSEGVILLISPSYSTVSSSLSPHLMVNPLILFYSAGGVYGMDMRAFDFGWLVVYPLGAKELRYRVIGMALTRVA